MVYKSENYKPQKKNQVILERAWFHVQSVEYPVTARWLFYRLVQEGTYRTKKDYQKFVDLLSTVRHNEYEEWRPDTLADDQRSPVYRGHGSLTSEAWARKMATQTTCTLAKWPGQRYYVEIWFEAKAMRSQFEHYTKHITLRPFGGHPSIPYKYRMAKDLEAAHEVYNLPIVILYFGDLDPAGLEIPETVDDHVRGWCSVPFGFVRCGLNPGDETKYNIPENYEKPGTYQWEGLDDKPAGELITSSVAQYVDFSVMTEKEETEEKATRAFRKHAQTFLKERLWEA